MMNAENIDAAPVLTSGAITATAKAVEDAVDPETEN
jgi:hypothetical protein